MAVAGVGVHFNHWLKVKQLVGESHVVTSVSSMCMCVCWKLWTAVGTVQGQGSLVWEVALPCPVFPSLTNRYFLFSFLFNFSWIKDLLCSVFDDALRVVWAMSWNTRACVLWMFQLHYRHYHRPMLDVVAIQEGNYSYPKTLGLIPWRGKVKNSFSVPPSRLLCRLICAGPLFVCTACNQICVYVTDPVSVCRKRVGLTACGMLTQKYCIH